MHDTLTELLKHASDWDPTLATFADLRSQCRHDDRVTEHVTEALRTYLEARRRVLALKAGGSEVAVYEIGKIRNDLTLTQHRVAKLCPMPVATQLTDYMAELSILSFHGPGSWAHYANAVDEIYAETCVDATLSIEETDDLLVRPENGMRKGT